MAEFNFGNRGEDILSNLARAELKRRVKGGAYFGMDEIRESINNEFVNNEKDHPELVYREDYSARLIVPKMVSIRFEETTYFDDEGEEDNTEEFSIELATCSISKTRNVAITNILNESGSIKQITGQKDYNVQIRGFLIGTHNIPHGLVFGGVEDFETEYAKPKDQIATLRNILETDVSLKVTSSFLDQFGISNLVVQSFSFPQDFETKNIQEFTIKAISDDPKIKFI